MLLLLAAVVRAQSVWSFGMFCLADSKAFRAASYVYAATDVVEVASMYDPTKLTL